MRKFFSLATLVLGFAIAASASNPVTPTTTLAAETGNNTSAASTFKTLTNGDIAAGNVSKMPLRSLLYPGATTKMYVHFMPWFGGTNHMNVGYTSNDATQVSKQVTDLQSRGVDGAIVDWYGPNSTRNNQTTLLLRDEAGRRANFEFGITEDGGALKSCSQTAGCDVTAQLISDLTYAYNNFEQSPAYMRYNGRPVVFFFSVDSYSIDWTRVRANVPGNPLFIFRNSGAFSKTYSDGGFGWVGISSDPNSMGLSYVDGYYSTAVKYPAELTYGTGYKGFNDTLASWGANRIVNQQCGQTWLATWAEAGKYYSTSRQLFALQVPTWNDYEEGTEIETGIDNCVSIAGAMSGSTATWSITGQENTLDHYTVFISLDGKNLMSVADVPAGTHSLDLSQYGFGPATYTIYVKAVGKATLLNHMSNAISWNVANQPPVAVLNVTPTSGIGSVTASATTAGSSDADGSIAATSLDFGDGTVIGAASASHTYNTPGTYTVTATVTDNLGATASTTATVTVIANQPPLARLSVTPGTGIAPVAVSASAANSTDSDGTIASTVINWGDGATSTNASCSHTYNVPGTYTVTATVTDNLGASSSATATVTVNANQPPVARVSVTPTTGVAPVTVTASTSASTDADGTITSSSIAWGDGTSSAGPTASHVYSAAGTYTVTASVTDNLGATSTTTAVVTVTAPANKPPVAQLSVTPTSGVAPVTVSASTAGSSDPDGTIASTIINWGDGTSTTAASGSHTYSVPGTYTVTASVKDNAGATSSATATVTVYGVKIITPTNNATVPSSVHVSATATAPSAAITAMKIYVDYVIAYSISANKLDTYLTLAKGTHRVVVQAWDKNGTVYKSTVFVTVQ